MFVRKKNINRLRGRVECVRWVAKSMRSMKIIDDPGFHRLMKTGRPHYRIPSSRTLARDVHVVFRRVKERIAKMLQVSFFLGGFIMISLPSKRGTMAA